MMLLVRGGIAGAVLTGMVLAGLGCGARLDPLLPSDAFVNRRPAIGPDSNNPVDRSGQLVYDAQHEPAHKPVEPLPVPPPDIKETQLPSPAPLPLSPTTIATAPAATQAMAIQPDTAPTTLPVGQFQLVGSVLATVNGQPIYADKVLAHLERALAQDARKFSRDEFLERAAKAVRDEIAGEIDSEVEVAAAKTGTKKEDQELAQNLTMRWRQGQITLAGGSEAVARQRAAQDGYDFEEQCRDIARRMLIDIYWQRKVRPLIEVNAQDIRRFYDDPENLRKYTVSAAAQYRVIKLDFSKNGGYQATKLKAQSLIDRAKSGEDFAALAGQNNDDLYLKSHQGAIGDDQGWMEQGAYAVQKVDAAVWQLEAGQVTPQPIETDNACYLAKVIAIRPKTVKPFSEVQTTIAAILDQRQRIKMRTKYVQRLRETGVVFFNGGDENQAMRTAMEFVMQRYALWTKK